MFGKIITAMVTPFDKSDNLNYETLKILINHLIRNNSSSLVVCGTTGEAPTLSDIEKVILIEKTLEYVNGRIPVILGVGTNCTLTTIDFIKKIEHLGVAGYLVVVPYYNKPDQEGIYAHFKKVANSTKKPIIIYNIPSRTGVDIDVETIKELAKISNIYGLKESSTDVSKIKQIKQELKDFKVYVGDDVLLYDAMINGADGIVSVASHIYGKSIHNILQLIRTKQYEDASAVFDIYFPKFEALFMKPNPVPIKAALNKLEINVGGVRLPLVDMKNELKTELYKILGI
ncbi:MAG: 4-hydroxy-tetrahydrodipicolinate synthase [Haloplasmataceae bacterium]|nr:4-hydroxy-tetrahydrodipicolinate synthase [Haloplasmataceae bacterium]